MIVNSTLRPDSKVDGIRQVLNQDEDQAETIVKNFVLPGEIETNRRRKAALKGWKARRKNWSLNYDDKKRKK